MTRRWMTVALLGSAVLLCGAKKAADEDEDTAAIDHYWDHPYLPDRFFDFTHEQWLKFETKKLPAFYEVSNSTYEFTDLGELLYTWEAVVDIREPDGMPPMLYLDWLDSSRDTEVRAFKATFTSAGRTEELDESRLVEGSLEDGSRYVSGDRALGFLVPRDRPGKLSLKITTRSQPRDGLEGYFGGSVQIQRGYYIAAREIAFVVPDDQKLRFDTRFFGQKPRETAEGASRRYTFTFANLMTPWWEAQSPHSREAFPSIFWSNQASWSDLGGMLSDVWEPELAPSPAIEAFVADLVEGLESPRDRAEAVHDAVADGWGYLGFYPGEDGWIPHAAESCFEAKIGDCKDQSALMITMMRAAGLEAYPLIIQAGQKLQPSRVPAIIANHAIVWVVDPDHPGGGYALDSTDTGTAAVPPTDWVTGRRALLLRPEGSRYVKIPASVPEHRLREDETTITFDAAGTATIELVERWHGGRANRRMGQRRSTPPSWWDRKQRERLAGKYPGATLVSLTEGEDPDDDNAYVLEATFEAEGLLEVVGERALLALPWPRGYRDDLPVDGWRLHPREQSGYENRHRMRVQLPEGAELLSHPGEGGEAREDWTWAMRSEVVDREVQVDLSVSSVPGRVSSRLEEVRHNFFAGLVEVQRRPIVLLLPEVK